MSELQKLLSSRINNSVKEIPFPKRKCISIEIKESITDAEILAVLSAFVKAKDSALVKHNSICAQKREKQELEFSLAIQCPQSMVEKGFYYLLANTLPCYFTLNSKDMQEVDFHQIIDKDEVERLARPSGRSFAQSVGILIGAECNSIFDLSNFINVNTIKKDFTNLATVVGDVFPKELEIFGDTHKFSFDIIKSDKDRYLFSYLEKLKQVVDSELVFGPPSFYTYAAACLDIPCIEVFTDQDHLNMYSKWSSFKYAAILVDEIEHFKASRLETAWKHWHGENVSKQSIMPIPADG